MRAQTSISAAVAVAAAALLPSSILACEVCDGAEEEVAMTRMVRRMQPDAQNATTGPKGPLEWGQINFLQTTDTHGWLEGHLKEQNYGADWGDFVSFVKHMRQKACDLGVDLLVVDTGDLHDGASLSDATDPNGVISNDIFSEINYDLLTIGNHELYETDIAYEHFYNFSKVYGERYVTSNVEIINPETEEYGYVGNPYRYFTTDNGIRVMAFGVLFNFTGNSNVSRVTPAEDLVQQQWFLDAIDYTEPIDMYVLIGHNPVRPSDGISTLDLIFSTIRTIKPDTPIQVLGGHTHIRDFVVFDNKATGIEAGRYCETVGWVAIDGFELDSWSGTECIEGVPTPTRSAVATPFSITTTAVISNTPLPTSDSESSLRYARRYLDWNRLTFAYHAEGSQDSTFDILRGLNVTDEIWDARQDLNLTKLYGCAPQTWCQFCAPPNSSDSIYTLMRTALKQVVVNETRADIARYVIVNTGSIRFDLLKGPFTYDDSFIVSPFDNTFQFIPEVPFEYASQILDILNAGPWQRRRRSVEPQLGTADFAFENYGMPEMERCMDPPLIQERDELSERTVARLNHRVVRRQNTDPVPGYTTVDDFGDDGDDTVHSEIPHFERPIDIQAEGGFPEDGSDPDVVDIIFVDFILDYILDALADAGIEYSEDDADYYLDPSFTSNMYLPEYAKMEWQENMPNCPVGEGIGFNSKKKRARV
ncbi:Metallo-dependent phosphatase-like protein [Lineolata rhizophorae]|uniref:Metallo-dependent phosphatase-like protein n=1 Tax=Lineolata rhizophorae TaxID=578093 RepID=A0A6A6NR21_9PEZI|nr:Metallo-dependent phosphatase-like protein [Lineolata rhizophorae]